MFANVHFTYLSNKSKKSIFSNIENTNLKHTIETQLGKQPKVYSYSKSIQT